MLNPPPEIAKLFPYRGACAFCGNDDARHRIVDSVLGWASAGSEVLADEFSLDLTVVEWILTLKNNET
jgi:hypothetical protein